MRLLQQTPSHNFHFWSARGRNRMSYTAVLAARAVFRRSYTSKGQPSSSHGKSAAGARSRTRLALLESPIPQAAKGSQKLSRPLFFANRPPRIISGSDQTCASARPLPSRADARYLCPEEAHVLSASPYGNPQERNGPPILNYIEPGSPS